MTRGGPSSRWVGLLALFLACLVPGSLASAGGGDDAGEVPAPRARASFETPDVSAPFLPFADTWPARLTHEGRMAVVRVIPGVDRPWVYRHVAVARHSPREPDFDDLAALPREWTRAGDRDRRVHFEGAGSVLVRFDSPDREGMRRTLGAEHFVVETAREADASRVADASLEVERTWFVLYDPLPPAKGEAIPPARGVVLFMPGMFGTPEGSCELIVRGFRERGWGVVRMLTQPSRFTQRQRFEIDQRRPMDAQGEAIARVVSERAAECAYAVQGAMDHAMEARPGWAMLPRLAVGCSAGAMTLPTVVAREPEKYAGAVMITGGAHLWLILAHSSLKDLIGATQIEWIPGVPTPAERAALADAYLTHAPLDPFHTAQALRGKRVLLIQGSRDTGVPTALGDVLWERLGRPERWMRPGDHLDVFLRMPAELPKILDWAEHLLAPDHAPTAPAKVGGP